MDQTMSNSPDFDEVRAERIVKMFGPTRALAGVNIERLGPKQPPEGT